VFISSFLVGCKKKQSSHSSESSRATSRSVADSKTFASGSQVKWKDPLAMVVDVNGKKLTQGMMDERIQDILRSEGWDKSPDPVQDRMRKRLEQDVIANFIVESLLIQESEQRQEEIGEGDIDGALNEIESTLPDGMTLDDFLRQRKTTREQIGLDREFIQRLRISKLLKSAAEKASQPTEEEVLEYFEAEKKNMIFPASFHARHILFRVSNQSSPEKELAQRNAAEETRELLLAGVPFEQVVLSHSECPSKEQGGDLGRLTRSPWGETFDQACWTQDIGAIGNIVETNHGFHIIQVIERFDQRERTFEEVRDQIGTVLLRRKEAPLIDEFIEELKQKATILYAELES